MRAIKEYAKRNEIILTKEHIYIDEGISGRRAEKRPAFQLMVATAKSKPKPFEVILVHKFDRFARSREDSVVYKSLLKKEAGIRVISTTEHIEDDKFSVILEAMLEAMAEYYSLNLSEEVKKGMTEKAERGEYQGKPPLGYRMEDKKLIIVSEEAPLVTIIFEKFASREMSIIELCFYLNSLGVKSKQGNPFERRMVNYILNNPVYIGKARWCPTGKMGFNWNNPDAIIRDSQHEPIISLELWEKAQERLREYKEIYRPNQKEPKKLWTWLRGIVRCSECGNTLITHNQGRYMQCNGYMRGKCTQSQHITVKNLEKVVLEELRKTFTGEIEINVVPSANDRSSASEYEVLQMSLEKISDREARVKMAFEDGIDTLEEYKANKKRLAEEQANLKKALIELKDRIIEHRHEEGILNKAMSVYELLTDESVSVENKFETARFLINGITYSKPEKTLKLVYK
jgi:DNA invertase Pin-like site-specific DNA recombinase